jgi:rhodanese-related sulfurtransferase
MRRAGQFAHMPQDVERDRVRQLQAQGAAIVETLPKEEFEHEHLAGAISLPLSELNANSAERVLGADKSRAIVTYCQGSD